MVCGEEQGLYCFVMFSYSLGLHMLGFEQL